MARCLRALLLTLLFSVAPGFLSAQSIDVVPDVVYGHKDGLAMTFDVLTPRTTPNGAGVLFMVSGGWVSAWSPPEQVAQRFEGLLERGFTVFVVRHGSSPRYFVPEIVEDVRRATRFIRANADRWAVDPDRLGAFGGSAGGHLALMLGTASDEGNPSAPEALMRQSSRIASVVAYYPPVDLRGMARGANPPAPADGQPTRFPALNFDRDRAASVSPLLFVTPDDAPTLLIHGDADELVNLSHSEIIFAEFEKNGVMSELIVLPGAAHGFRGEDAVRASEAMVEWFERTLVAGRQ
jgi:acetyl esterase/lipase